MPNRIVDEVKEYVNVNATGITRDGLNAALRELSDNISTQFRALSNNIASVSSIPEPASASVAAIPDFHCNKVVLPEGSWDYKVHAYDGKFYRLPPSYIFPRFTPLHVIDYL
jgi:hypothetical protein